MASSDFPNYGKLLAKNVHVDESGITFFKNNDDTKSVTLKVTPSEAGNVNIQLPTSAGTLSTGGASLSPGDIDNSNLFAANVVNNAALASDAVQNSNVSGSAAIAYSKLNLSNAVQNSDLAGSIEKSKLAALNIANADVAAAAAIASSKLADAPSTAGTVEASKLVQADANKDLSGARHVTAEGTIEAGTAEAFRLGGDSDNSWRVRINAGNLVFEKKESGTWNQKGSFTAS